MEKIVDFRAIKDISGNLKKQRKKIVFTNGCFDIIHYGHVKYLERCKRLGDILIVGLNSDKSVKKNKGAKRPIMCEKERAYILSSLQWVDYVTIFDEKTPYRLIRIIKPDILVKGGDWRKKNIVGGSFVKRCGGRVLTIPYISGYSTTSIIEKIKNG